LFRTVRARATDNVAWHMMRPFQFKREKTTKLILNIEVKINQIYTKRCNVKEMHQTDIQTEFCNQTMASTSHNSNFVQREECNN